MADREHHKTRRKRFTLVLVPDEDAARSRSVRFAPWQLTLAVVLSLMTPALLLVAALYTTPVGGWMNVPNPEIENRYAREIVAIKAHVSDIMGQLVELRSYNAMLRNALGEKPLSSAYQVPPAQPTRRDATDTPVDAGADAEPAPVVRTTVDVAEAASGTTFPAFFPAEGYVSRGFEPDKGHYGIDIAGKTGSPVRASADGYVVFAGWTQDDGNTIILSHAGGFLSFYKHNHSLLKPAGVFVRRGEPIAGLGNTGETSLGPHVHFEVWKDGSPRDPAVYLLNPIL